VGSAPSKIFGDKVQFDLRARVELVGSNGGPAGVESPETERLGPTRKCSAPAPSRPACRQQHKVPGQLYQVKVAQNAAFEEPGLLLAEL
jgi:hypothetical protein